MSPLIWIRIRIFIPDPYHCTANTLLRKGRMTIFCLKRVERLIKWKKAYCMLDNYAGCGDITVA